MPLLLLLLLLLRLHMIVVSLYHSTFTTTIGVSAVHAAIPMAIRTVLPRQVLRFREVRVLVRRIRSMVHYLHFNWRFFRWNSRLLSTRARTHTNSSVSQGSKNSPIDSTTNRKRMFVKICSHSLSLALAFSLGIPSIVWHYLLFAIAINKLF